MKFGVYVNGGEPSLDSMTRQVHRAAELGFDSAYFSQLAAWDVLTVAALIAERVPGIALGTAVVPTYPRHPLALAAQALTAQAASGNRFVLGVGPSHRQLIEGAYGYSYDHPARHVREYLSVLKPLLRGESVDFRGDTLTVNGRVEIPAEAPPLLLSALGPVLLRIAGELADGVVTVWAGPKFVGDEIVPAVHRAAAEGATPRIVATVIVAVTDDPDRLRGQVSDRLGQASNLPSYRTALDRQGVSSVADTVVAGDETVVAQAIARYAEAGVTEFAASLYGTEAEKDRTLGLLASLR